MRIGVYGAGAIGGHLAARLAQAGAEVSVVARGATLEAIRRDGIAIEAPDSAFRVSVAASDNPADLGRQDAVIVAVKAPSLPQVAAGIGSMLGPETPVVFAMNGIPWWYFHGVGGAHDGRRLPRIDPGDAMWDAVGPDRSLGCAVYSSCTATAPNVVRVEGNSKLVLGMAAGAMSKPASALVDVLLKTPIRIDVTERIRDAIWTKLLLNLSTGALCALAMTGLRDSLAEHAVAEAARRAGTEGFAIARALGADPTFDADQAVIASARLAHKPSIVQDLERGRPMEIDALVGAPLEFARLTGVATPTLDLLFALVTLRARAAGLYG